MAYQLLAKGFPILRWYITILADTKRNNTTASHGKIPRPNIPLPSLQRFTQENVDAQPHGQWWLFLWSLFIHSLPHPSVHSPDEHLLPSQCGQLGGIQGHRHGQGKDRSKALARGRRARRRTSMTQCGQSRWKSVFRSTLVEKDAGLASSLGKGSGGRLFLEFYSIRWPCPVWADLLIVPWFCFLK